MNTSFETNKTVMVILVMLGAAVVSRIHLWRIKKNYARFLKKQQENEDVYNLNDIVEHLNKLFEIQEQGQVDYFLLIILILIVLIL